MIRAFKYKLNPTKAQADKMTWTLERCRELYNAALKERITAYKKCGVSVTRYKQDKQLTEVKEVRPEYNTIHSQILQDVIKRLDAALSSLFQKGEAWVESRLSKIQRC